jgi:hypothetical protein
VAPVTTEKTGRAPGAGRAAVLGLAWLCGLGLAAPALAAPKTDVVTLVNGDRITGEVKGLEQGQLKLKTDAAGTIYVEWGKIASLKTDQYLQVELQSGVRHHGQAPEAANDATLRVVEDGQPQAIRLADIVRIDPIEQGELLKRLDGYLTAGYNFTKANDLQTFTFTGGLSARTEQRKWSLDGSTSLTSQQGNDDNKRWNLVGQWRRFLRDRWFADGWGSFESNDELALDFRALVGGDIGRYLLQTNEREWGAYAGLAYNDESYTGRDQQDSLEALFGTQYSFFRYDHPEVSLNAMLNVYPSLTESGRLRAETKVYSRYEIVKDLFFEVSLYGSYDNQPGDRADSNSDYGLTTSLGYSF